MSFKEHWNGTATPRNWFVLGLFSVAAVGAYGAAVYAKSGTVSFCPTTITGPVEGRSHALDQLTATNQTIETPVQVAWQGVDGKMWTAIIKPLEADC